MKTNGYSAFDSVLAEQTPGQYLLSFKIQAAHSYLFFSTHPSDFFPRAKPNIHALMKIDPWQELTFHQV